jgi:hypothetical protein
MEDLRVVRAEQGCEDSAIAGCSDCETFYFVGIAILQGLDLRDWPFGSKAQ